MHLKLPEFDFFNGIFYGNVAEGAHRSWKDCRRYGFLAAGNGRKWSEQLDRLNPGDVLAAYLKGAGYVGVGIVTRRAVRVKQFRYGGKPLDPRHLEQPRLFANAEDPEIAQYLVAIDWKKTFTRKDAKFRSNAGLYTPQRVIASLGDQPKTRKFIEENFDLSLDGLAAQEQK